MHILLGPVSGSGFTQYFVRNMGTITLSVLGSSNQPSTSNPTFLPFPHASTSGACTMRAIVASDLPNTLVRTATAISYSVLTTDQLVAVTDTSAARTITLPTAVGVTGKMYMIKDESGAAATNNITIATTSSQKIDGASTRVINTNYGFMSVYSDGANWLTIN